MPTAERIIELHDCAPAPADFRQETLAGLQKPYKTLPCKFFYDEYGSQLFDQICGLTEYYPTRTESQIMHDHASEMAALLGSNCLLVEYGSGSSTKTRILLDRLPALAGYVPVDISREHLQNAAARLSESYPGLEILPTCADYTQEFTLPQSRCVSEKTVVYFPGSTIGNFHPQEAVEFLTRIGHLAGPDGGLLIGVDLKKSPQILEPAYNDALGITAAFQKNLLTRINRELRADFNLDHFEHYAFYNSSAGRIEMHLVSLCDQQVHLGGIPICFDEDETIHTECSYKYSLPQFAELAFRAGWQVQEVWTDQAQHFSVQYLTPMEIMNTMPKTAPAVSIHGQPFLDQKS